MADNSSARAVQLSFKKSTGEGLTSEESAELKEIERKNKMTNDVIMSKSYSGDSSQRGNGSGS